MNENQTAKLKPHKGIIIIIIIIIFFFLISKLRNIFTKKGQALEYTGSIQRKEKKKKDESGTYTNHPKQKRLEKLENAHKQAYNRVLPLIIPAQEVREVMK